MNRPTISIKKTGHEWFMQTVAMNGAERNMIDLSLWKCIKWCVFGIKEGHRS